MNKRKTIGIFVLVGLVVMIIIAAMLPGIYSPGFVETVARNRMLNVISNQLNSFRLDKKYMSAEEFQVEKWSNKDYKIEMMSDQKSFQIWATPIKYGWTTKISYYADSNDGDIRGADHQGGRANETDSIIQKIPDDLKEALQKNQDRK